MTALRLPGLMTGIDTNVLISQMMAIERRTLNMYQRRKDIWDEKKDALSTIESKLSALRSSVRALSDADELRAFKTASSDTDILTAEASYNAFEGNHTVEINQLASAERWVHTAGLEYAEDYVGEGTFIYSYNHQETILTTTTTTTLEELVGLINNDANNPGVTASMLRYNDAYHLVLNGNEAGTDYAVKVNSKSTEVWQMEDTFTNSTTTENATLSTKITELSQFTSGTWGGNEHIDITGTDHFGVAATGVLNVNENTTVGHLISEINDAFDGRAKAVLENGKIVVTDSTCDSSSLTITLTYDPDAGNGGTTQLTLPDEAADWDITEGGATSASLTDFESDKFTLSQAAQDSKIKVDGFPSTSPTSEIQTVSLATAPDNDPDGGTFTLTYCGETTDDIAWNANAATIESELEELSTVNENDITVSAPIDHGVTFTFANTLGNVDLLMINSSLTDGVEAVTASIAETVTGSDGYISRSSNTVDDVINGVTLHLHDTTAGEESITLTRDIDSVKAKLNSMIASYNSAVSFIKEKTGYNDVLDTAGVLIGDYILSAITSQLRTPLYAQTSGFVVDVDTFLMPGQIGLELDRDGVLSLDTNAFSEAVADDYMAVLAVIGADKTGSSTSDTIEFYGASSNYTTAGSYDVQVKVTSGDIEWAKIKLSTESTYRDATYSDNIVTGNSAFNDNGDPMYPENALQLSVDLSEDGTFTATVRVKQGFTGAIEDAIDKMLKTTTGTVQIAQEYADETLEELRDCIKREEDRLVVKEEKLILRFAKLESALALLQNQMAALGFGYT